MRRGWIYLVIVALVTTTISAFNRRSTGINNCSTQDEIDDFVPYQGERFNIFDWNLFQNMAKSLKGNLLISPISLKLALVLLYEGSQDETAMELATVMHLPVGRSATREKFTAILKSLQTEKPEYRLNLGSRMYIDDKIVLRQRYGAIAKSFYSTDVININFSDTKTSAKMINTFISNATNGHIRTIIDDEKALKDNMMLVVNGIYFKGTWFRQPFALNETKIDKFYLSDKMSIGVPFMRASSKFYLTYSEELKAKILRLPYAGHKYSMFLILPQTPGTLPDVIKKITPAILNRHIWLMQEVSADIMIPKFNIDFTCHFENNLRELGIKDIFDNTATLTGILRSKYTSRRLIVTDIVQKAGIEVSERGTIAYAASKVEIGNKMNDETFHANHPFLFYIEDESTGTILYMGVVNNPLEETGIVEETTTSQPGMLIPTKMPPRIGEPTSDAVGIGVEERQNFFNIELLQELNEDKIDNVIVGSASVKAALMILAEAAAGRTRKEITSSLRLPSNVEGIREIASHTLSAFKDDKSDTQLQTAIKLWVSKGTPVGKNYSTILKSYYNGNLETINFEDQIKAVKTVNNWVKESTHGQIDSIVDQNSLPADASALLTTAVFFKGVWKNAFDKNDTRTRCFHVPDLACQNVSLMENVFDYRYAFIPALDAQVVEIPYTGERVSMLVILPKRIGKEALEEVSRDLAFTPISSILASLEKTEVQLHLPKFSIQNKMDLRPNLEKLGIRDLFNKNANLTTAFPDSIVQVGAVMHNAQIEVNEEGTIAAAVTGVSVIPLMGQDSTVFRADRPFIFLLLDLKTNGILFAGRYVKPEISTHKA